MMVKHDPTRLTADPGASPLLRSVLADARRDLPESATIARLTSKVEASIAAGDLGPELGGPELGPNPGVEYGSLASGKALLVAAGLVAGAAVIATVSLLPSPEAPSGAPRPGVSAVVASSVTVAKPKPEPARPVARSVTPPAELAAPVTPSTPKAREPRPSTTLSETALLDQARTSLRTDPSQALSLTKEHARRFPQGALAQEREVIAIEALSRLGRTEVMRQRATQFERQYPGSAHQPKVEQVTRPP